MKNKLKLLTILLIIVLCAGILVACNAKEVSVYKQTYEDVFQSNSNYYVVLDDGKYIAYNTSKHKKVTDSYDYIEIVSDLDGFLTYFLVGNIGDIGKTLLNSKGDVVMESTAQKKINAVNILFSESTNLKKVIFGKEAKAR